ncbi:glycoside hydrolase family 115 protein [Calocera viscosa TUFC12733]|uniref:Glycoside hydrolase family 115 protein n=1 Tax=Calocera viscosa (strain TUFC12733) TaxID=1330018 RepID=A0A167I3R3_CALVF|nr:glycoside hydrolase family 115 protein [Calocera viscosa TUFC12733]
MGNVTCVNALRKPELVNSTTYNLTNYGEANAILATHATLNATSWAIWDQLDPGMQPAYFQLVHHPLQASYTLQKMYIYAGLTNLYARQARLEAKGLNDEAAQVFEQDYALEHQYHTLLDGKWQHIMDQTHMGLSHIDALQDAYWQQPMQNTMPAVNRVPSQKTALPGAMRNTIDASLMRLSICAMLPIRTRPSTQGALGRCAQMYSCPTGSMLPFDTYGLVQRWVDISAGGPATFNWTASSNVSWLSISETSGTVTPANGGNTTTHQLLFGIVIQYLFKEAMATQLGPFYVPAYRTAAPSNFTGFVEGDGVTPFPVAGNNFSVGAGPSLECDFYLFNTLGGNSTQNGNITLAAVMSPSLDNRGYSRPLGFALQLDNSSAIPIYPVPIVSAAEQPPDWDTPDGWVANSMINTTIRECPFMRSLVSTTNAKFIINTGGLRYAYLGPPGSAYM